MHASLTLQPIAIMHSPYQEKFSVPRQPNLVPDGVGVLELLPPYNQPETVRGLEQFSHLWLIFQFDKITQGKWHPTVRPPRLGGNQRVGVFASRATHRPNPIGLSKVELRKIECAKGKVLLHLGAVDLINGTPIFDIKPYLAYADSQPDAQSGFAQNRPNAPLQVEFSHEAQVMLAKLTKKYPHLARFIQDIIAQDPRPAYLQGKPDHKTYGIALYEFNIKWRCKAESLDQVEVLKIEQL